MRIVRTLCASKPGFTCRIAMKVRISSDAPIISTTASATSVITSSARVRLCRALVPLRFPLSLSAALESARDDCRAGKSPHTMAVSIDNASVNPKHPPVEFHVRPASPDAWYAGAEAQNGEHAGVADRQTQAAANERQHHALGQQLPDNPPASGSQCGTNRDFPFPGRGTRQHQAGHIRASDQQHEADGAEEDEQGILHASNDGILQTLHAKSRSRAGVRPGAGVVLIRGL